MLACLTTYRRWAPLRVLILIIFLGASSATAENSLKPKPLKEWPFVQWSYAKAYAYNFFPMKSGVPLTIYKVGRWSPHIKEQRGLERGQAEQVADIVASVKGTFETARCFFPRHAVVFFAKDGQPVGIVDICFECEGQRAWPDYKVSFRKKYGAQGGDSTSQSAKGFYSEFDLGLKEYRTLFTRVGIPVDHLKQ